jgi:CubicO group peptidase (beta-lactamase class C family)
VRTYRGFSLTRPPLSPTLPPRTGSGLGPRRTDMQMTKWMTRALGGAAVLALLAPACGDDDDRAAAPPTNESPTDEDQPDTVEVDEAALQAILDQWRTDVDAYGATLSLRVPGHDDVHLASGIDDRDPETPMPTDGTYGVASITKTFVAATALQLVDEGRLSLDEPVEPWLPEIPHADEVTLAMLLGHTAGLGPWKNDDAVLEDLTRSFTPEELLARQLQAPPAGQPGERFYYTNAGYTAAGVLIERVLDQDLATVFAQRFTEPLALQDTQLDDGSITETRHGWFEPGPGDVVIDMVGLPQEALMTTVFAAGNVTSSSADLLDWGDALYSGELLGPEATATMLDMRSPFTLDATNDLVATDEPTRLHYGLGAMGFCLDPTGCSPDEVEVVGHSGGDQGYRTLLAHHPASGTTLAFFANWRDIPLPTLVAPLTALYEQLGLT